MPTKYTHSLFPGIHIMNCTKNQWQYTFHITKSTRTTKKFFKKRLERLSISVIILLHFISIQRNFFWVFLLYNIKILHTNNTFGYLQWYYLNHGGFKWNFHPGVFSKRNSECVERIYPSGGKYFFPDYSFYVNDKLMAIWFLQAINFINQGELSTNYLYQL